LELRHYGVEHFIHTYRCRRALVVAALVEELFQERRNNLLLKSVVINLPWTGAGEEGDTRSSSAERKVHRQTIPSNQTPVVPDIRQMFEKGCPLRQHIGRNSFLFKARL